MTERWRKPLAALGDMQPDRTKLRTLTTAGPRMPEPSQDKSGRSRILAGAIGLLVGIASIALVIRTFDQNPADNAVSLDPTAICAVPTYDPNVALLVGNESTQYPTAVLEDPGRPPSSLSGQGSDELRAYLSSTAARFAPTMGWRAIASSPEAVTFAAPHDGSGEWWVVGFELRDAQWRLVNEEIVDQRMTPAQKGRGLTLAWNGDLIIERGAWNEPLQLVNEGDAAWEDDTGEYWASAQVFDPATGRVIASGQGAISWRGGAYALQPGESAILPVALGATVAFLASGTYDVVACVSQLGLASPVGTLQVRDDASVRDVRVLTYPYRSSGAGMAALGGGVLTDHNGCLAVEAGSRTIYVVWPEGYTLVERDGHQVLIDPIGTEVGQPGDHVTLGGGYGGAAWAHDMVIGGLPAACRAGGESYFITSGPA